MKSENILNNRDIKTLRTIKNKDNFVNQGFLFGQQEDGKKECKKPN